MRKGDAKRQAILDTAQRLFYQKGFEQTSVQDILDVLKCSKGSFYHHFESKLSVLETLCDQRAQEAADRAKAVLPNCSDVMMKINCLGYYLFPLRKGEEQFMSLLLPLSASKEGVSLNFQYARALTQCFEPLWEEVLGEAVTQGVCYPVKREGMGQVVLLLLNQCWQQAAQQVMNCLSSQAPIEPGDLLPVLEIYRSSIERLLDAPFASVELMDLEEMSQVCTRVLTKLRMEM